MDEVERTTLIRATKILVGSVSYVAAVLLYCGWTLTQARVSHFGIYASVIGYSTQEYMLRSAAVLFRPAVILAAVVLVAVIGNDLLGRLAQRGRATDLARVMYSTVRLAMITAGVVFVLVGAAKSVVRLLPISALWEGPLLVLVGTAVTWYAWIVLAPWAGDSRRVLAPGTLRLVSTVLLLTICLESFWVVDRYANQLGDDLSRQLARRLSAVAGVVVYSEQPLGISASGITVDEIQTNDGAQLFRYDGLCFLAFWNGRYFLVPHDWREGSRDLALMLHETDLERVEFRAACVEPA